MKGIGKMISKTVMELKLGRMGQNLKEIIKKEKNMAMEPILGVMEVDM